MNDALYDIPVTTLAGEPSTLRPFAGRVLLVVNVASKCGLTPQYESLERVYERERERGLVVLGFPSNQFGAQEPGTSDEIGAFCTKNYGVQFPMFEKLDVNGEARHPLYGALVGEKPGDITWNFEKFLISRDGRVAGRFGPRVTVDDAELAEAIERELSAPT